MRGVRAPTKAAIGCGQRHTSSASAQHPVALTDLGVCCVVVGDALTDLGTVVDTEQHLVFLLIVGVCCVVIGDGLTTTRSLFVVCCVVVVGDGLTATGSAISADARRASSFHTGAQAWQAGGRPEQRK